MLHNDQDKTHADLTEGSGLNTETRRSRRVGAQPDADLRAA